MGNDARDNYPDPGTDRIVRRNMLDDLPDDRLAVAMNVLRLLRMKRRGGVRSWWYPYGTEGAQAAADLFNFGGRVVHVREVAAGIRVMLCRRRSRRHTGGEGASPC